ncbi:hypothetical protein ILYODFUR_007105 [Ilyodon furcidens]|uniref:Uncharacterized protein n=1 Tax=Ilyodon furcidens TaxID=33524 RepID=A0ABV0UE06_9TELE
MSGRQESLLSRRRFHFKHAAKLFQGFSFNQIDVAGASYSLFFLFHPLLLFLWSLVSPNSSSCTIPTTEAVAIQHTSDGAKERAIVPTGLTSLLSIDWKAEREK